MAYTYNDVQSSTALSAVGDVEDETMDDGMDLANWAAIQQAYMSKTIPPTHLGTESVVSAAELSMEHVNSVSKAASQLSGAQSVANVHLMSDNFIRDSITGR